MSMNHGEIKYPFLKKFSDNGLYYIYDVNTNQVVEVDPLVYDIIGHYNEANIDRLLTLFSGIYTPSVIKRGIGKIRNAREHLGLFSSFRPKMVCLGIGTPRDIENIHKKGIQQLVLEVTRDCNLNCAYCATSGKYSQSNWPRLNMSAETCKKVIDFYLERTGDNEIAFITFYGGEPMLRFDLMKEAVNYVKERRNPGEYKFNLTTNGTVLDRERLDFFIENDFSMLVSLDGPESVNDRYRQFKNGGGTFKRIIENLELIRKYNRRYFVKRISISSVLAPPYDEFDDIIDFFSTHETLKEISRNMMSNAVDTTGTSFFEDFGLNESGEALKKVEATIKDNVKEAIMKGKLDSLTIEKKKLYTILYNLARRPIKRLHEYVHPFGACHIGLRRLFADVEGNFNICEKVHKNYHIGNVETGFDYERIVQYYKTFDSLLEDCKNCWAMNHCERCWATLGDIEEWDREKKETFCSLNKGIVEKALVFYTQLLRENPDCMKVFNDVVRA